VHAILAAGIRRVVFATPDVDPRARGGALLLKTAGVAVAHGLLEDDVRRQNALFFHRFNGGQRPFVALKLAVSLDAKIADHRRRSQWITGEEARAFVHWLRAGFEGIGVGLGTVREDDPSLTARGDVVPLTPPRRVVFDTHGELPGDAKLVKTAREVPTLVLSQPGVPDDNVARLARAGVSVVEGKDLGEQLHQLRARGVHNLLVEGGGVLAGRLIAAGLVDRLFLIQAPILLGRDGVSAFGELTGVDLADVERWKVAGRRELGMDMLTVLDRP
jgi:diaminohydroxyphosphoribosylaminopyrimidine deaminase/5-amino-6-(5-phosphoribosylamino)uracil reductase